jgi:dihydropteroate synthase
MTKLVGILNVTPDSFSDGGQWNNPEVLEARMQQLFDEGADIIDVGGESTRPGATPVAIEEEQERLKPVLDIAKNSFEPWQFSFDTRHGKIAEWIVHEWSNGVLINDVTGLSDPAMVNIVNQRKLKVVVGHLPAPARGNIAAAHQEKITDISVVKAELAKKVARLVGQGLTRRQIILDPGIGFGKHPNLNHQLITFAAETELPVMVGYSRKRFLGEENRNNPEFNAALGQKAVVSGAAYLRVHDVAAHKVMMHNQAEHPYDNYS